MFNYEDLIMWNGMLDHVDWPYYKIFANHVGIDSVAEAKRQLLAAGFHLLNENEEWDLKPGGRYFFTRNMSSLIAFAIGEK